MSLWGERSIIHFHYFFQILYWFSVIYCALHIVLGIGDTSISLSQGMVNLGTGGRLEGLNRALMHAEGFEYYRIFLNKRVTATEIR